MFTPQILENFRRHSASGLSLLFIIVWLLGDVFNIIGAILQGVLPTMTILAVYYTFADLVLLSQCFYYRGWRLSDLLKEDGAGETAVEEEEDDDEDTPLLRREDPPTPTRHLTPADADRRRPSNSSNGSFSDHFRRIDGTHLSPATPLLRPKSATDVPSSYTFKKTSTLNALLFNTSVILLVCAAGVLGWWLSARSSAYPQHPSHHHHHHPHTSPESHIRFDVLGQVFGYLCAALYLGSRIPQLLLNYRRKSTEGVSMLFFLFACVGNLTYVLSIFAYEPVCARIATFDDDTIGGCGQGEWRSEYGRYVLVNTSWLIGSGGTLLLDLGIFAQFWMYRGRGAGERG